MKIATPPEKSHPPLSQQPPSKIWGPVKLPNLFENLVGGSTHPLQIGGDAHYGPMMEEVSLKIVFLIKHN